MATATNDGLRWITRPEAARILCIGPDALQRLMDNRVLTVRLIPGGHPKLDATEVEALASRYTTPAKSKVEGSAD